MNNYNFILNLNIKFEKSNLNFKKLEIKLL